MTCDTRIPSLTLHTPGLLQYVHKHTFSETTNGNIITIHLWNGWKFSAFDSVCHSDSQSGDPVSAASVSPGKLAVYILTYQTLSNVVGGA